MRHAFILFADCIDDGGLAYVRDASDHDPGAYCLELGGCIVFNESEEFPNIFSLFYADVHCLHAFALHPLDQLQSLLLVRQVHLVEHHNSLHRRGAFLDELSELLVVGGDWYACVADLNEQVGLSEFVVQVIHGLAHVAGKPVDVLREILELLAERVHYNIIEINYH